MSVPEVSLAVVLLGVGVVALTGLAKRIGFSAPILLVVAGFLVSLLPWVPPFQLDPQLVLFVLLPPLLYSAAQGSSLIAVKQSGRTIGTLAIGLVLATALAVGLVTKLVLPDVSWGLAIALGAVVAPPDAVAASAIARRAGLPRRLVTILEGESLFNDATALVLLRVSVAAVVERTFSPGMALLAFVAAAAGGVLIGGLLGYAVSWLRRRGLPPLLGTALSLVTPFGVYLLAEEVHTSGVIAVVVFGLLLAHRSPVDESPAERLTGASLWSTVNLLLEGAVFALIGLQLTDILAGVAERPGTTILVTGVVLVVVLLVRPLWVFGLTYVARITPWTSRLRPPIPEVAVISWAGMRGVVSLAAAQTLPLDVPHRDLFVLVTVVVIMVTLGVQGPTLPLLIRRVGVRPPDPRQDALELARAQQRASDAAERKLTELAESEGLPERLVGAMRRGLELRTFGAWEQLGEQGGETPSQVRYRVRRELLQAEREVFIQMRDNGYLEDELLREVQRRLDLEESLFPEPRDVDGDRGHQEILPSTAKVCDDLRAAPTRVPDADPHECPRCVAEGLTDWVHIRACLECGEFNCCDSSPARHAAAHFHETGHPVMGSAEVGEQWRWCFVHQKVG